MKYKNIFRLVIAIAMLLTCAVSYAHDAKYTYNKPFKFSCTVKLDAVKQDNKTYISVSLQDGNRSLLANADEDVGFAQTPVMTLTTCNDETITLPGTNLGIQQKGHWDVFFGGSTSVPLDKPVATAWFEITDAQIEMLKDGILKISITTTPYEHEKKFSKDKIGKKLYQAFGKLK